MKAVLIHVYIMFDSRSFVVVVAQDDLGIVIGTARQGSNPSPWRWMGRRVCRWVTDVSAVVNVSGMRIACGSSCALCRCMASKAANCLPESLLIIIIIIAFVATTTTVRIREKSSAATHLLLVPVNVLIGYHL